MDDVSRGVDRPKCSSTRLRLTGLRTEVPIARVLKKQGESPPPTHTHTHTHTHATLFSRTWNGRWLDRPSMAGDFNERPDDVVSFSSRLPVVVVVVVVVVEDLRSSTLKSRRSTGSRLLETCGRVEHVSLFWSDACRFFFVFFLGWGWGG